MSPNRSININNYSTPPSNTLISIYQRGCPISPRRGQHLLTVDITHGNKTKNNIEPRWGDTGLSETAAEILNHAALPGGKVTGENMPTGLTDKPEIEAQVVDGTNLQSQNLLSANEMV